MKFEFKKRTETIDGVEYTLTEPTAGEALDIQDKFAGQLSGSRMVASFVAACLGKSLEEVLALPWAHLQKLINPALEMSGIKVSKDDARG